MSLIIDRDEMWTCRDCGTPIDDEMVDRICDQLRTSPIEPKSLIDDAHHPAFEAALPGACAVCGGGRVVCRMGELAVPGLPRT